jgi:hypothetical protein
MKENHMILPKKQEQEQEQEQGNVMRKHVTINGIVNVRKNELKKCGYVDFKDWSSHPNNLYIGRNMSFYVPGAIESKWHNPYVVGKNKYTIDHALEKYKDYVLNSDLINQLHELDGKTLGCWCKPGKCHGDVLQQLIESQFQQ